ncbi:NAD-dependent epimerase/dehydratase family protein [Kitasatospora sp. GAS1066B]|uniref:NAD-dependent epimerase/dehydratase family protein n=1 Tax=Kitasatospora sp. GAS1066B TaxID=3156271 RepID=UPI00351981B9
MRPWTVVLTGAGGFIGGATLDALRRTHEPDGRPVRVRAVVRTPPPSDADRAPGVRWVTADLTDPASLHGLFEGADAVVHAASYVGPDEATADAVNRAGTASLMARASAAGVPRLVQLSTVAVYGRGPHRGAAEDELAPAPGSVASRTRLAGEPSTLAAGGLVLRAGLVLGAGDRWVVPALADLVRRVPAHWDGGQALLSVVAVEDLARLLTAAALAPRPVTGVYHAGHPAPVRNRDLLAALAEHDLLPPLAADLPWPDCLRRLRSTDGWVSERQFVLLGRDHYYRSDRAWQRLDCPPGPGPLARLDSAAAWYRDHLRISTSGTRSEGRSAARACDPAV